MTASLMGVRPGWSQFNGTETRARCNGAPQLFQAIPVWLTAAPAAAPGPAASAGRP